MLDRLLTWSARWPLAALVLALVLSGALALAARPVEPRYEIEDFFPADTPERATYERAQRLFGRDDRTGFVVVEAPDRFDQVPATFQTLHRLTRTVEAFPEVERVVSPTSALVVIRREGNVLLERAIPATHRGPIARARVTQLLETYRDPPYRGGLVSDDGRLAVVAVVLKEDRLDFAARAALHDALETLAVGIEQESQLRVRLAGYPLHRVRLARLSREQSRTFLPLTLLAILLVSALGFRSLAGVALPLAVAAGAALWATGLMGILRLPPNIFGPAVYVMIAVVGVADAVHLLARHGELLAEGVPKRAATARALQEVGPACFLASLTTAIVFASLVLTGLPMIVHMGLQIALGVGAAFLLTLLLFPACVTWLGPRASTTPHRQGRLTRACLALDDHVARHPRRVVAGFLLLFLLGGAGASAVRVNAPLLADLDPEHPIRVTNRLLEERLSGVVPLDLIVEPPPGSPIAAYSVERMTKVERLTARLRAMPEVTRATSAVDPLRRLGPLLKKVPASEVPGLLPTALLLAYEQVSPWVNVEHDVLRIRLRLRDLDSEAAFALFERIEGAYEEELGEPAQGKLTGQGYLAQVVNRDIVRHFQAGFLVALLAVCGVLLVALGDPRLALTSLIPNLTPVVLIAGVMGLLGIELRYTSALVLTVVFGLAVDDTIHFVAQLGRNRDAPDPIRTTFRVAGPGLVLTSLLLAAGFATLLGATFLPLRTMGALLMLTALFALAADLLLLPALLRCLGLSHPSQTSTLPTEG